MPGARRGAAVRFLLDEGPPPRRVVPGQRRPARKDSRSAAPAERGEVARADEKFGLGMEDRDFQRGAYARVQIEDRRFLLLCRWDVIRIANNSDFGSPNALKE